MSKRRLIQGSENVACGCYLFILLLNLTLGAFCFNYCLGVGWGTSLPWYLAMLGGLFLGELTIPAALILWLVTLSGAATPLFG